MTDPLALFAGFLIWGRRRWQNPFGGLFGAWARLRQWDDDIPTSAAWDDWSNHVMDRAWDDAAPTVAPTVSTPADTTYRIWDDEEPTT